MNNQTGIIGAVLAALAASDGQRMPLTPFIVVPQATGLMLTHKTQRGWRQAAKRRTRLKLRACQRANRRAL